MTIEHRRKIILESIANYKQTIQSYQEMLNDNEKKIKDPKISQKKKELYQRLNEVIKQKIGECEREIERLINE